jgi:hypothetical protein
MAVKKKSDKEKIMDFLLAHGSITPMDAMGFGCYRLSARIHELRSQGANIITDDKDADGNHVNYAIYRLKEGSIC